MDSGVTRQEIMKIFDLHVNAEDAFQAVCKEFYGIRIVNQN